jgi:hypothetical protein
MWDLRTYWGSLHVDAFNETIFVDILEIAIIFGIVYFLDMLYLAVVPIAIIFIF